MKKLISLILILILAASIFAGCKSTSGDTEKESGGSDEIIETQTDSEVGKENENTAAAGDSSCSRRQKSFSPLTAC